MGLTPGIRLGPYRIDGALGAGGMGEVYAATDTRLDRAVAIKVLPPDVREGATSVGEGGASGQVTRDERRERFEREARAIAALNHPHICTLHDVGRERPSPGDGPATSIGSERAVDFLVLERLEGETLQDRLARGPVPLPEALEIAIQVADALDRAHRHGITHRDLKPGNVFLVDRRDGGKAPHAKLLDFGLAKLAARDTAPEDSTRRVDSLTAQGTLLGTFHYMAPEQLEGRDADARSDIWAFGCVLYEMITGRRPFGGASQATLITAIMSGEPPDLVSLQPLAPTRLDRLVSTCLAKHPDERWQSARDMRRALSWIAREAANDEPRPAAGAHRRRPLAWLAAGLVIGLGCALALSRLVGGSVTEPPDGRSAPAAPTTRTVVDLPADRMLTLGTRPPLIGFESPPVSVSPDGRHVVYVGRDDAGTRLYHRALDTFEAPRPLGGTEGALFAFFSPDGEAVGFLTQDRLKRTTIAGGQPVTLSVARTPIGASWAGDAIYMFEDQGTTLSRVPQTGGEPVRLTSLPRSNQITQVLPGGRAVLLETASPASLSRNYSSVGVMRLDDLQVRDVGRTGFAPTYVASGHLLYARAGSVLVSRFDLDTLSVVGDEVVALDDVAMQSGFGIMHLAASRTGVLAYVAGRDLAVGHLAWVDRDGTSGVLAAPDRPYGALDLDPSGHRIAVQVSDVQDYVWIWDERVRQGRAVATPGFQPIWDATGQRIAYRAGGESARVLSRRIPGGEVAELATGPLIPRAWSSSGALALDSWEFDVGVRILSPDSREPELVAESGWGADLSPDGRFFSYAIDTTGRFEVWVQEIDGDDRQQVSTDGGVETVWCGECSEVFFRNGSLIYGARVTLEPTLGVGPPAVVFEADEFVDTGGVSFDVTSDGRRLYYVKRAAPPERTHLRIVQNWFTELDGLAPRP